MRLIVERLISVSVMTGMLNDAPQYDIGVESDKIRPTKIQIRIMEFGVGFVDRFHADIVPQHGTV